MKKTKLEQERERARQQHDNAHKQATDTPAPETPPELLVRSLLGRKAKPVRYLVEGKIPVGKVTMIAGQGGMGKSTLVRHLIACLTTGRPAFGLEYTPPPPCDVLLASVEDSPEDTILPHLLVEGADLDRVKMIEGIRRSNTKGEQYTAQFDIRDMVLVKNYVVANPTARMLIIDPIMSFIGRAGANENASSEVRALLDPFLALSAETGIAPLLIAHLNKAVNASAMNRIVGSSAFRDACRVVYAVGMHPDDRAKRVFVHVKDNVPGLDIRSIAFTREPLSTDRLAEVLAAEEFSELDEEDKVRIGHQLAIIRPLGFIESDADGILGQQPQAQSGENNATKVERCCAWLRQFLSKYAFPSAELTAAAIEAGFKLDCLKTAKAKLGRNGTGEIHARNYGHGGEGNNDWWNGLGPYTSWIRRPEGYSPSPPVPQSPSPNCTEDQEEENDGDFQPIIWPG